MQVQTDAYSLADFFLGESADPLVPPADFTQWRQDTAWATSLYEPTLAAAPAPRTALDADGAARPVINLSSYNYLGLVNHPATVAAAQAALAEFGTGACGSPLLSGTTRLHRRLETRLQAFLGREAVLLFTSGFGGAMGSLAGCLRKGDVAVIDSKAHFSLIAGVTLAQAKLRTFAHNDPEALDEVLTREAGQRRLVILEGVYSMDGDMANLPALVDVAQQHQVSLFIDEAHSILTCGPHGQGVVEHFGLSEQIGLQYGTFSKAFAGIGGFVGGRHDIIDYLRLYATPYGFSCALPPSVVASLLAGLDVATSDPTLRQRLWSNAVYFRSQLHALGLNTGDSTTYVIPIILGEHRALLYELGHRMRARGLFLAPVDYPSVPQDQVRFRAAVTAAHTRADLDAALNILEDTVVKRLGRMV